MTLLLMLAAIAASPFHAVVPSRACRDRSCMRSRGTSIATSAPAPSITNNIIGSDKVGNWWVLRENGTTQGSALTMTASGNPPRTPILFNGAQYFSSGSVAFPTSSFTVVASFKLTSLGALQPLVGKWPSPAQWLFYVKSTGIGELAVKVADSEFVAVDTADPLVAGSYIAMAASYNALTGQLVIRSGGVSASIGGVGGQAMFTASGVTNVATENDGSNFLTGASWGFFFTETVLDASRMDIIMDGVQQADPPFHPGPGVIAFDGHSILNGLTSSHKPPSSIAATLGRTLVDQTVSGSRTADCIDRWTSSISNKGYAILVWMCGTNSLIDTPTGNTVWTGTQPTLDAAIAQGMWVKLNTETPCDETNVACTPAVKQGILDYNTSALAWCAANPTHASCADVYTSVTASDSNWVPAYDDGDGFHPNTAGTDVLIQLDLVGLQ